MMTSDSDDTRKFKKSQNWSVTSSEAKRAGKFYSFILSIAFSDVRKAGHFKIKRCSSFKCTRKLTDSNLVTKFALLENSAGKTTHCF